MKYEASIDKVLTTAWTENSFKQSDSNHVNVKDTFLKDSMVADNLLRSESINTIIEKERGNIHIFYS